MNNEKKLTITGIDAAANETTADVMLFSNLQSLAVEVCGEGVITDGKLEAGLYYFDKNGDKKNWNETGQYSIVLLFKKDGVKTIYLYTAGAPVSIPWNATTARWNIQSEESNIPFDMFKKIVVAG
jgi:hypothetical protein